MAEDDARTSPDGALRWLEAERVRSALAVAPARLSESAQWCWTDGRVVHRSGRFFGVVGLAWEDAGEPCCAPFLEQREVGTLGFLARPGERGRDLLVQAKAEPGNVGLVQLAPTCQATASNRDRVHGGTKPPYSDRFEPGAGIGLSDSLQSEQGSRFLGKRNRNVVLAVDAAPIEDDLHCWIPAEVVFRLLARDFAVNTDARSVLVTSDWEALLGRPAFPGHPALAASLARPPRPGLAAELDDRRRRLLAVAPRPEFRRLDALDGLRFDPSDPVTLSGGPVRLLHIAVAAPGREVPAWDQPILDTVGEQHFELDCVLDRGVALFGFRLLWEPGLVAGAELAPSRQAAAAPAPGRDVLVAARQSDEGGRFLRDVAGYAIRRTGQRDAALVWLTLAEIRRLLPLGWFGNEARSALSLLLALA